MVTANLITGLGIDEFFQRTDGVGARALLPDALGSTVALGDSTGTLQTQYTYEPFGYATQTGLASTNSYRYTGREDDGSGLDYYRARYYHPRLQRFISEDPIGFVGGDPNFYAYVSNNPGRWVDPTGLDSTDWNNTQGGRSRLNGPTNGNWGGKCWSGGQYSCAGYPSGSVPPMDSGDQCYERHDDCDTVCAGNKICIAACDRQLVKELDELSDDSRLWPNPPRLGTERDSERYRNMGRKYFLK